MVARFGSFYNLFTIGGIDYRRLSKLHAPKVVFLVTMMIRERDG